MKRILLLLIAIICLFSCEKAPEEIPVSSVTINQPAAEMVVGETVQLSANVLPSNATDKTLSWASSKQSVATVSSDGLVTAIAEGSSTITVTAGDKSASCKVTVEKKVVPVSSVSLNLTELSLVEGEESTLVATVKPNDADDKTVTWKSSDATIVSVNSEGKVSALKAGTATITASAGDKSASCKVTVEKKFIPVTSVTLNKSELSIVEGSQETLIATVKPDDATDKTVTWKSSNTTIVSVSSDGKLSALKEGSATITASAGDKSATCKVLVEKKVILVTSITLNKTDLTLVEGHEETLVATVKPDNATDKTVTWKSSDASIASVNGEGRVSALKEGSTTITATAGDKSVTCKVTVEQKPKISSLKINDTSFNGLINKYYSISVTVTPSDAQYDLEWSVSNPRVAEIQGGGLSRDIYTKDFGVTEIIVTDKISGKSASITVKTAVTDFEWKESTGSTYSGYPLITIEEGQEYKLHYSCTPSSATHLFEDLSNLVFYEPTYVVDKPSVISIDPEGKVTGLKIGTVGIKPTGSIIKKSSGVERVYIKVKAKTIAVTEVRLDKSSLSLNIGESATLSATVLPENATDKTVTWKSSDASIVSVTYDGKVSAIKAGTVTITVSAGDKSATCEITVIKPSSDNIVFADEKIKEKLVAAFDKNNDGELSYEEAAAVTSIDGVFGAIKTYKSFDEFQYFTGVTSIPNEMCKDWNLLSSIILPKSITRIGNWAFYGCQNLSSIVFPPNVTSIGTGALYGCTRLSDFVIPKSVTYIGGGAFGKCESLTSIVIPEGINSLPYVEISFGGSWGMFQGCSSLISIVIPKSLTHIGNSAFFGCSSLTSIIIPDSVTSIGRLAFDGCASLKSIVIPDSVRSIGHSAFCYCESLSSIVLPKELTTIDYSLFRGCTSLTSVVIPESVTSIGGSAFSGCTSLSSIVIPESVSSINAFAFMDCTALLSVIIPESVTSIMNSSFENCTRLVTIAIPESVSRISSQAFKGCTSLTSIVIPKSVTSIEDSVFQGCTSLSSVIIPDSVTSICYDAFNACSNLKSIVIPQNVTILEWRAFEGCTQMASCTVKSVNPPTLQAGVFKNNNCVIYVPASSVDVYKVASGWSDYADRIQAIPE